MLYREVTSEPGLRVYEVDLVQQIATAVSGESLPNMTRSSK